MNLRFDISVRRPGFAVEAVAEIREDRTALFGPSGAGKTTLLLALAGLLRHVRGWIELEGKRLVDSGTGAWTPPERRRVGLVFQDDRLFPHLTVEENLLYGWRRVGPADRRFNPSQVAELLELGTLLKRSPGEISGGEARRVALGRALLASPRLLLLDEPLTGLDLRLRRQILPFLRRVQDHAELPILHVSHDLESLLDLCDYFVLMDQGRVMARGRYLELLGEPAALRLLDEPGLTNVLRLEVVHQEIEEGLTHLCLRKAGRKAESEMPEIRAPFAGQQPPGTAVDLALRPRDISIARAPVRGISIQNQVSGKVKQVYESGGHILCIVGVGRQDQADQALIVEVTRHAVHEMGLQPGEQVWCLFKTQSLRYL